LDVGVVGEAAMQGGEIDGAVMLVDLDGVAAAEGDVRAADSGEMGELACAADGRGERWRSRSGRLSRDRRTRVSGA